MCRGFTPNDPRPVMIAKKSPLILLGNCFWREGFVAAFGPEQRGAKGGCGGKRGGDGGLVWRWAVFRQEKSLIHALFY